jgi:hypothetical protein
VRLRGVSDRVSTPLTTIEGLACLLSLIRVLKRAFITSMPSAFVSTFAKSFSLILGFAKSTRIALVARSTRSRSIWKEQYLSIIILGSSEHLQAF